MRERGKERGKERVRERERERERKGAQPLQLPCFTQFGIFVFIGRRNRGETITTKKL